MHLLTIFKVFTVFSKKGSYMYRILGFVLMLIISVYSAGSRFTDSLTLVAIKNLNPHCDFSTWEDTSILDFWDGVTIADNRIKTLNIQNKGISSLPKEIDYLTELQSFYLNSNSLTTLPETFGNLDSLYHLDLNNNELEELPESFGQISIVKLNLSNNQLTKLPSNFDSIAIKQSFFRFVDLSNNRLESLPFSFGRNFHNLKRLDLSNNNLRELPGSFNNLKRISTLKLAQNNLSLVPNAMLKFNDLDTLDLSGNQIDFIEDTLFLGKKIRYLNLSSNQLTEIPQTVRNLFDLEYLNLANNRIAQLPQYIGGAEIQKLILDNNLFIEVPEAIKNMRALSYLSLKNNQLATVYSFVGDLLELDTLILANNTLCNLPREIMQLNPNSLDVGYNKMVEEDLENFLVSWLNSFDPDWIMTQNKSISVITPVKINVTSKIITSINTSNITFNKKLTGAEFTLTNYSGKIICQKKVYGSRVLLPSIADGFYLGIVKEGQDCISFKLRVK